VKAMSERPKDTYDDYLNPNDVSNWLSYTPFKFMMRVLPILNEKAESIGQMAVNIKKPPSIDASTPLHYPSDLKISDILDMIVDETFNINRILRTSRYYFLSQEGEAMEITREKLIELIEQTVDRRLDERFGSFEISELWTDEPEDTRTWDEVKQSIETHRWTPPAETPSVEELLREDRDR
jgi:hypothetical protein